MTLRNHLLRESDSIKAARQTMNPNHCIIFQIPSLLLFWARLQQSIVSTI